MKRGKELQRKVTPRGEAKIKWDEPLDEKIRPEWDQLLETMKELTMLSVPRAFTTPTMGPILGKKLFCFTDASSSAVAFVVYLQVIDTKGQVFVSFVSGNALLSPRACEVRGELSIPRAELTAAEMGASAAATIEQDLNWKDLDVTEYFTDSMACLGWLRNRTDRFSIYVSNRRRRILEASSAEQCHYVPTAVNPADVGTRPISVEGLIASSWLKGHGEIDRHPMSYWEEPNM